MEESCLDHERAFNSRAVIDDAPEENKVRYVDASNINDLSLFLKRIRGAIKTLVSSLQGT